MADYFGNGFWAVRYFPSGYWGLSGEQPDGAISATIEGQANVTASLSYVSTVTAATGGGRVKKARRVLSWPRFEPVHIVTFRHGAAKIGRISTVSASLSASGGMVAAVRGGSTVKAAAKAQRLYTQDVEFWLMAA